MKTRVAEVIGGRDQGSGQVVELDVTLKDGRRETISFPYAEVAAAVRHLLAGHVAAALARKEAGTLDVTEHAESFVVRSVAMDLFPPSHAGLAFVFDDHAVLPVQLDTASARQLGRELIEAAEELRGGRSVQH